MRPSLIARTPSKSRARLLFAAYAGRLLAPRLALFFALTVGGALLLRARMPSHDGRPLGFLDACYLVFSQLLLEPLPSLPEDPVVRALCFFVPLIGAVVLGEGLFKLGASLFDFKNHRDAWMRIMAKTFEDHVILVGLGTVGFRVLEELLRRGTPVVACESDGALRFVEEARARGVPVIVGDARNDRVLRELGAERAAAIIACTDDDLVNLEVAVDGRQMNPRARLVMRMFDQNLAQKLGNAFSLESSFSTSAIAAPLFAAAALDERVHGAYRLGDSLMVTLEVPLGDRSALVGRTVGDIESALEAPVVGIRRAGRPATHRFARTETLGQHDAVLCHVAADAVERLRREEATQPRPVRASEGV